MINFLSSETIEDIIHHAIKEIDLNRIKPPPQYEELLLAREIKYIIFKGGRGSAKTISAVNYAIDESFNTENEGGAILFVRELSQSLEDTQDLVESMIEQRGLSKYFTFKKSKIKNRKNKTTIHFRGCRATSGKTMMSQLGKLKGISNVFLVIGDEAQDFTSEVLDVLFPTINRKSQIVEDGRSPKKTRWIFCMNPQRVVDPVIAKVETQKRHKIIHVNITDLPPEFQDEELLENMESERKEFYFPHVWLGEPFHGFSGAPFAHVGTENIDGEIRAYGSFIDPSFAGGDYTSISFIGTLDGSRVIMWGYAFKQSWMLCKEKLAELMFKYLPEERYYESNAIADAPREIFAKEFGIDMSPHFSLGAKEHRIYRGASQISPNWAFVENHSNKEWLKLTREYTMDALFDDPPDSLVSCLMKCGVITYKEFGKKKKRKGR